MADRRTAQHPGNRAGDDRRSKLERRVIGAAEELLARRRFVAPVEVLTSIGWLTGTHLDRWRRCQVPDLAAVLPVGPDRLADAVDILTRWAEGGGLRAVGSGEVSATRDRRPLRYVPDGAPDLERALATNWMAADLSDAARRRVEEKQRAVPDLVAMMAAPDWCCDECGRPDTHRIPDGDSALCLTCADLDHLSFLAAGDATLTRRARRASTLSAVVLEWDRRRQRFRRLGLLVEPEALDAAEEQCLDDAEVRLRRRERDRERRARQDDQLVTDMTDAILRLFPGCLPTRAGAIAAHAAVRGSGRVGRSAAGRALDSRAVELAVRASVRHLDTDYDHLLMTGVPRDDARRRIGDEVDRVLDGWRSGGDPGRG